MPSCILRDRCAPPEFQRFKQKERSDNCCCATVAGLSGRRNASPGAEIRPRFRLHWRIWGTCLSTLTITWQISTNIGQSWLQLVDFGHLRPRFGHFRPVLVDQQLNVIGHFWPNLGRISALGAARRRPLRPATVARTQFCDRDVCLKRQGSGGPRQSQLAYQSPWICHKCPRVMFLYDVVSSVCRGLWSCFQPIFGRISVRPLWLTATPPPLSRHSCTLVSGRHCSVARKPEQLSGPHAFQ